MLEVRAESLGLLLGSAHDVDLYPFCKGEQGAQHYSMHRRIRADQCADRTMAPLRPGSMLRTPFDARAVSFA